MGQFAALHTRKVEGFEEISEVVAGTPREVVQIQHGKLSGHLSHATIDSLRIDTASFNLGLRTRGVSGKDAIIISMLAASSDRVTRSSYQSYPGDVLVIPPCSEHESRYYGGSSMIIASVAPQDVSACFTAEGGLSDPTAWQRGHFKGNGDIVANVIPRLQALIARLGDTVLSAHAAEFWKRTVIEAMSSGIIEGISSERDGPLPSALKIVRQIEEYLDAAAPAPVHISQICSHIHLSRRTLHRAFHEALGIGPITFLRHRRLCAIHSALREPNDTRTISDIALQYGFQNLGRFAGYYRELFGEYPSQTRPHSQGRPRPGHLSEWSDGQITSV